MSFTYHSSYFTFFNRNSKVNTMLLWSSTIHLFTLGFNYGGQTPYLHSTTSPLPQVNLRKVKKKITSLFQKVWVVFILIVYNSKFSFYPFMFYSIFILNMPSISINILIY